MGLQPRSPSGLHSALGWVMWGVPAGACVAGQAGFTRVKVVVCAGFVCVSGLSDVCVIQCTLCFVWWVCEV